MDGINHINIFSRGLTSLGKMLSNFARMPITIGRHGKFASIEGYWYWLGTRNDALRDLAGYEAKSYGKILPRTRNMSEEDFRAAIKFAMREKVRQYSQLAKELKESSLPFEHYYVFGGRKQSAGFQWIVDEWETIRRELKG